MRLQDILALVSAGYTRAEIERMAGADEAPASNKAGAEASAKPRRRARRGGKGKGAAPESAPTVKATEPAPNVRGVDYSAALASLRKQHAALFHDSDAPGRLGGITGDSLHRALEALGKGETLVYLSRKGQTREAVTVTAPIAALLRREATLRRDKRRSKGDPTKWWDEVLGA